MKKRRYKYFFIVVFIILSYIFLGFLDYFKLNVLNNFLELQTKEAKNKYISVQLFPRDTSDMIFDHIINTPEVIAIFKDAHNSNEIAKNKVRNKLYAYLKDEYNELKKYNIQQLHFHLPNNDSFLRFHRPKKYGDNLTSVRKTVAYANKHQKKVEGFEEGRIFNGYRFVYPLFDENKNHIGSVEISHSINSFKNIYQRSYEKIELIIVLSKDVVLSKVFSKEMKNYEPSIINKNFMHQKSMKGSSYLKELTTMLDNNSIDEKMDNFEDFSVIVEYKNNYYVVSFIAIKNSISDINVAYAISFQKSVYLNYYYDVYLIEKITNLLFALFITIIAYFVFIYYKEIKKKAYFDTLVNIYNRRFFESYLQKKYFVQKRNKSDLSLIMFDIDHFKSINDKYGHDIGDISLIALGNIVCQNIRKGDIFARWGGEEFMLLVEVDLQGAIMLSEHLRLSIENDTKTMQEIPGITCSFGVISLNDTESLDEAYKLVDKMMYKAKSKGRNRVVSD